MISRGVVLGRRAALATVLGNCAGVYVQVIRGRARGRRARRAVGRDLHRRSSSSGRAYLVWLGVRTFQKRRSLAEALGRPVGAEERAAHPARRLRRRADESQGGGVLRGDPAAVRRHLARARAAADADARARLLPDRAGARQHLGARRGNGTRAARRVAPAARRRSAARAASCWSGSASASPSPAAEP